ncbi:hypothetical protein LEMLEM_LOCUS23084 [Lemmus lemmus]
MRTLPWPAKFRPLSWPRQCLLDPSCFRSLTFLCSRALHRGDCTFLGVIKFISSVNPTPFLGQLPFLWASVHLCRVLLNTAHTH